MFSVLGPITSQNGTFQMFTKYGAFHLFPTAFFRQHVMTTYLDTPGPPRQATGLPRLGAGVGVGMLRGYHNDLQDSEI